jgi:hypothetical protein
MVPYVPPPLYIPFVFSHNFGKPLKKSLGEEAGQDEKRGRYMAHVSLKKRRKRMNI